MARAARTVRSRGAQCRTGASPCRSAAEASAAGGSRWRHRQHVPVSSRRSSGVARTGFWSMRMMPCWRMHLAAPRRGHGGRGLPRRRRAMNCRYRLRTGCGGCRLWPRDLSAPSTVLSMAPPPSPPATSLSRPASPPSWSGLARPSTSAGRALTTRAWMAGPSPAMTKGRCLAMTNSTLSCAARCSISYPRRGSHGCATHLQCPSSPASAADGRDTWQPRHPHDALVRTAFRRDMRRDKGFGPALGTAAPNVLMARGCATASAPSDWRIPRTALRMQRALIDGTADAARNARPAQADAITEWQEARLRQALRGRLAITIGHRDILFLPPGG